LAKKNRSKKNSFIVGTALAKAQHVRRKLILTVSKISPFFKSSGHPDGWPAVYERFF